MHLDLNRPSEEALDCSASAAPAPRSGGGAMLVVILAAGLAVRLALWHAARDQALPNSDERDYNALALNLIHYGEYGNGPGNLLSLRPPLYPALVAGIYLLAGEENFQAVRLVQAVLSLAMVLLTYGLGRMLYSRRIALWAAGFVAFYPSFLGFNNLILTEVLFTFLLLAFCVAVVHAVQRQSPGMVALAGVALGLGALTRSVLWLFPPLLAGYLLWAWRGSALRRLSAAALAVLAFAVTLAPWTIRNTDLHQTFVTVDVMGGRNFMMGNYQHTPLFRSWDTIALQGDKSWIHEITETYPPQERDTQGKIDRLAFKQGMKFVLANPGLTLQRSAVKFFDFWGLERELIAGASQGFFGPLDRPVVLGLAVVVAGAYAAAIMLGIFGALLVPAADRRGPVLFVLLIVFVCGMHTVVFGHSRYHLPLMPFILLFAAGAALNLGEIWRQRGRPAFWLGAGLCALLIFGWTWLFLAVDKNLLFS